MFLKKAFLGLIIMCSLGFSAGSVKAAWWEVKSLPVPVQTEQTKELNRKSSSAEMDVIYYSSKLGFREISDFYREKLSALGWKESDALSQLGKISDVKVTANLNNLSKGTVIFRKDNEMVVIRVLSEGTVTKFMLGRNKISPEAQKTMPDVFSFPREERAPLVTGVFAEYPNAELVSTGEKGEAVVALYLSADAPDLISSFYKKDMSGYGWTLNDEPAPRDINFSTDLRGSQKDKVCPTCVQDLESHIKASGAMVWELGFSNQRQEKCAIQIFRLTPGRTNNYSMIMVVYEKS